jgi:DNA-binding NarL/FixJ family response regulator
VLKPRILLADDHLMVLAGLQKLLERDFDVVGTAEDGRALLKAAAVLRPDLIVADVSMPLLDGFGAARQLAAIVPETKIVFLSMHSDSLFAAEALDAGGAAYVLKRDTPEHLITAIRKALRRKRTPVSLSARRSDSPITPRQKEVLQLTADGKSLKEIAYVMNISVKTVEFHKYRLMQHLDLHTNADLIKVAIRNRLAAL